MKKWMTRMCTKRMLCTKEMLTEEKTEISEETEEKGVKDIGDFLREEDGMGTVEIILIVVVLISLVIIFKRQLTSLVNTVFDKINDTAGSI